MLGIPPPYPIRILLVDDQSAILTGVNALIMSEAPHMEVVGQARSAGQARVLADAVAPDIVVLDVDLAGEDGLALIPHLLSASRAAIVVFTCLTDPELPKRALGLGASAFVAKTASGEELLDAIRGSRRFGTAHDNCHAW